jgi:uncharacterized iron-regulated membrane protein
MKSIDMQSSGETGQWLLFFGALAILAIGLTGFVLWIFLFRKPGSHRHQKRSRRREHRKVNPTLAETGGLPPVREPNQPPRGT